MDDGSVDGTSAVALNCAKQQNSDRVRVLKLEKNLGKVRFCLFLTLVG